MEKKTQMNAEDKGSRYEQSKSVMMRMLELMNDYSRCLNGCDGITLLSLMRLRFTKSHYIFITVEDAYG